MRSPCTQTLLSAALFFFLLTCGESPRPVVPAFEDPVAVRQPGDRVWIRWENAPEGRVQVFQGEDPAAIERENSIGELEGGSFTTPPRPSDRRPYFELVADSGASVVVAERLLPLEGAHNFRDLGGYPTRDGRRVRWGQIYRSDHLGDLTDDDLAYLEGLGIRTVCDFRGAAERASDPDRLGASGLPRSVNPAISDERFAVDELQSRILSGDLGDLDFATLLVEGNRAFARDYTEEYSTYLELFENEANLPIVFHCTAGKDRAGFAAFLILTVLGVPEQTAIRDYLLTQPYTQSHIESTLRMIRFVSLFRTDSERLRPLMGVEPAFIQAGIDAAVQDHGSLDAYLENALGFGPERRDRLRARLLR
jgi:protein-tyrosine phosphatase